MRFLQQFMNRYGVILILISFLLIFGLIFNTFLISSRMRIISNELAIQRISLNLGILPDWQKLWEHIDEVLKEGMPREDVLKELDQIGNYVIELEPNKDCEVVEYQLGIEKQTRYRIRVCYKFDEVRSLKDYSVISD